MASTYYSQSSSGGSFALASYFPGYEVTDSLKSKSGLSVHLVMSPSDEKYIVLPDYKFLNNSGQLIPNSSPSKTNFFSMNTGYNYSGTNFKDLFTLTENNNSYSYNTYLDGGKGEDALLMTESPEILDSIQVNKIGTTKISWVSNSGAAQSMLLQGIEQIDFVSEEGSFSKKLKVLKSNMNKPYSPTNATNKNDIFYYTSISGDSILNGKKGKDIAVITSDSESVSMYTSGKSLIVGSQYGTLTLNNVEYLQLMDTAFKITKGKLTEIPFKEY